ncbi:MAG TPA: Wzz/FepE/Etk N-terminal domain-containing protein [Polymorphobacter sp.]|nr:Wzz/FepE/Etk N-terminal domain-containing protein [Polymorphobacter sp.]
MKQSDKLVAAAAPADIADPDPGTDNRWLEDVVASLRARWWMIVAGGVVFALIALIYLWTADYKYSAALRVSATQPASGRSAGLGSLGGLAAIAGVGSLGSDTATPFKLYIESLQSRPVAAALAADPELMHIVFARQWDAQNKRWHEPASTGRAIKNGVFRVLGLPVYGWEAPGAAQMQVFLSENIGIDQNVKTPLVTIGMESPDPAFAVRFLTKLHGVADQLQRDQSRARTESNIAYLTGKLATVSLAEYREVLFNSIADQEKQMMLVNNSAPFAAEPFGPATASLYPTNPRIVPTLIGFTLAGLLVGAAAAVFAGLRRQRQPG